MLLVEDLLNEVNENIIDEEENLDSHITEIFGQNGLSIGGQNIINGIRILFVMVTTDCKITVNKLISLKKEFYENNKSLLLCFCFDVINGMQRKRLLEEQISFCVKNKEIHIFPNNRK